MNGDFLTWAQIGVIVAAIGTGVGIWRIRRDDKAHYDLEIASIRKEIAEHKLHVAIMHPTSIEINNLKAEVMGAINQLSARIDRLLERDK